MPQKLTLFTFLFQYTCLRDDVSLKIIDFARWSAKDFTSSSYYRLIPNVRYIVICQPLGLKKRYPFLTENVKIVNKVFQISHLINLLIVASTFCAVVQGVPTSFR